MNSGDEREAQSPRSERQLRIALVTDWFLPRLGGIEMHIADLARALRAGGCEPEVLTTTPGAAEFDGIAVRRPDVALAPGFGFAVSPRLVGILKQDFAARGYDVIHAHVSVVSPLGYAAVLAARSLGLPAVVTFHSVLIAKQHVLRAMDRLLGWSRWPMVVSGVSELVAAQLRAASPQAAPIVLSNGVDPSYWRMPPHDPAGNTIVVASAMRLHPKKRPLPLLRAFAQARAAAAAQGRRLVLRIAGEGAERKALERFVMQNGLQADVELPGALTRDALRALYAEADIFVLPSVRESFGIVALEARCAGLPVVAMRAGGATEFLRHEETALLADDDTELAAHLTRLALDDAVRRRLAAPDPGLDRYAWPAVVDAHLACYGRAVAFVRSAGGGRLPEMTSQEEDVA